MPRTIKLKIGGVEYTGREEQFEIVKEDWSEYKLLDGGRVRVKTSAQKIIRIIDENGNPALTPEGDP